MNWSKLAEFFSDSDGQLSMTRLLMFMSFVPASVTVWQNPDQLPTFLGFYVGGYVGGALAKAASGPTTVQSVNKAENVNVNSTHTS